MIKSLFITALLTVVFGTVWLAPTPSAAQNQAPAAAPAAAEPVYKPPPRGAPGGRVGGACRGTVKSTIPLPTIELLAPDSTPG